MHTNTFRVAEPDITKQLNSQKLQVATNSALEPGKPPAVEAR